jgi:hypothetical protein
MALATREAAEDNNNGGSENSRNWKRGGNNS